MPLCNYLALLVDCQYVGIILLGINLFVPGGHFPVSFVIGNRHEVLLNSASEAGPHRSQDERAQKAWRARQDWQLKPGQMLTLTSPKAVNGFDPFICLISGLLAKSHNQKTDRTMKIFWEFDLVAS
jgi:hypothetical protein